MGGGDTDDVPEEAATPLLDELVAVRQELKDTREHLEVLQSYFKTSAKSIEERRIDDAVKREVKEARRKDVAKIKKLEDKVDKHDEAIRTAEATIYELRAPVDPDAKGGG